MITLQVAFGGLSAPLRILLPQEAVLKATIVLPKPEGAAASDPPEWAESLTRQVRRSNVTLRARISLAPMTLGDIVRMKPGDVLPFADGHDVDVRLDANGRDLARCELGRSGSRYMLRLRPAGEPRGRTHAGYAVSAERRPLGPKRACMPGASLKWKMNP